MPEAKCCEKEGKIKIIGFNSWKELESVVSSIRTQWPIIGGKKFHTKTIKGVGKPIQGVVLTVTPPASIFSDISEAMRSLYPSPT